jgi:hypothetical protein
MYDMIGDIHGHADHLEKMLQGLGYRKQSGAYCHPERKVIVLGDMIDRGPDQVGTVRIIRAMVDAGNAVALMGNHEYNAVAFATPDPEHHGEYLRRHTRSNTRQHLEFLKQVGEGSALHRDLIGWFKTLPIFLDEPGYRAIHACWHTQSLEVLSSYLDKMNEMKADSWIAMHRKGTAAYEAMEIVLKGLEISLPDGVSYIDGDGNERSKTRTRWWDAQARTYREAGMVPKAIEHQLPDLLLPAAARVHYDGKKPLFFGHYWMKGTPTVLGSDMVCLDYSIGKGDASGSLCAYRWEGESALSNQGLRWYNSCSGTVSQHEKE